MIYDCVIFFNELDLLEVRLNELKNVVDKFVIVEASFTHSSKPKEFCFENNKERYEEFSDQIIYWKVTDLPHFPPQKRRMGVYHNRHEVEHYHRNCTWDALSDCKDGDIILIGDVDEIPTKQSILETQDRLSKDPNKIVCFQQRHFNYYFNGVCVSNDHISPWYGQVATTFKRFNEVGTKNIMDDNNCSPMKLRMSKEGNRIPNSVILPDAGWHFSYLGGIQRIIEKVQSYSHQEFDTPEYISEDIINKRLTEGEDIFGRAGYPAVQYIELDETFPSHVLDNQEKFTHLIKDV